MRSGEKKIFIIQIVSLIVLLFNSIFHEFLGEIGLIIFLIIMLGSLAIMCGIPRDNNLTNKASMKLCIFYSLCFLVLKYSLGMITGFFRNPYNLSFVGIVKNTLPALIMIVLEEKCRFTMVEKSGCNRAVLGMTVIVFTFLNFTLFGSFTRVVGIGSFLKVFTTTFMVWLFYNLGLTLISFKHGFKSALVYACIFYLYRYLIPILPGFSVYVSTIVDMLIPILIALLLHVGVPEIFKKKKNKEDIRNKHILSKCISVFLIALLLAILALNSNLFRFWSCVVGSGSMEPTIMIGDKIIVDKSYKNRVNELDKGDIIVFSIDGKNYTHRIIEVRYTGGEKTFITQGDRVGQAVDNWIVTKNEIVGKTVFRLKGLGLPTVWIKNWTKEL